ncbi:MAG: hypothetical protein K2X03_25430 [Bryobacteraceae bacterium]|nr:hypothetical protein [Bryobacteraceae bacterium]
MANFTVTDLFRILSAFFLLTPILLFPGYVGGSVSNGLGFRDRSLAHRLLIALPLSFATAPLGIYLSGRAAGLAGTWAFLALATALFLFIFYRDWHRESRPLRVSRPACLVAAAWIAVALAVLVDFQYDGRLYISTPSWDYTVRNGIISSITRTGVTPESPFFSPGHAVPLRYHHLFLIICSLVESLTHGWLAPGHALAAATLWCGLALFCSVWLYLFHFRATPSLPSVRSLWTGILLVPVMGLDLFPNALLFYFNFINFTVDKWNEDLVGWFDSLLWAPHYVAATVACLMGFLLLWTAAKSGAVPLSACAVAGTAFACATGMGIYVVLVFAAALAVYLAISQWKGWKNDVRAVLLAGAVAAALALPYLASLAAANQGYTGPPFIFPAVRSFKLAEFFLEALGQPPPVFNVVNLALLPLHYALELGLLFICGVIQARRYARRNRQMGRKEWAMAVLIGVPVVFCSFFRSGVIANNDLGWRGFLIPQFLLLLLAVGPLRACLRRRPPQAGLRKLRPYALACFWVGLAGTLLAAVIDRGYMAGVDHGLVRTRNWVVRDQRMSERLLALRQTYEWIDQTTPKSAFIQPSPAFLDFGYGLYARRPTLASDEHCGTAFGGSPAACAALLQVLLPVFAGTGGSADSLCRQFPLRVVIVKDTDAVWQNPQSWVWKSKPAYANAFSRVFACPVRRDRQN